MDSIQLYKVRLTILCYSAFIAFGVTYSIVGPSIPDMCERLQLTPEDLAEVFSINAVASMVVAVFSGFIVDRFQCHHELLLALSMLSTGIFTMIIPSYPNYWLYLFGNVGQAASYVFCDQAGNVLLLSTWGESSNSPLTGLHAMWGLGFTLTPLIIRPYFSSHTTEHLNITAGSDQNETQIMNLLQNGTIISTGNATQNISYLHNGSSVNIQGDIHMTNGSQIEIAFCIVASFALVVSALSFISYCVGPPKEFHFYVTPNENIGDILKSKNEGGSQKYFTIFFMVSFSMFYLWNAGKENILNTWLFHFAVTSDLNFSKQDAAMLDFGVKFAFLLGRLIATAAALIVPVQIMLFCELYGVLAVCVCLVYLGPTSKVCLWVFACLNNFLGSPVWPAGIAWMDRYSKVSGITLILLNVGSNTGIMLFQYITGWVFTHRSADDVLYLLLLCAVAVCVQIVPMQLVATRHGRRQYNDTSTAANNKEKDRPPPDENVQLIEK